MTTQPSTIAAAETPDHQWRYSLTDDGQILCQWRARQRFMGDRESGLESATIIGRLKAGATWDPSRFHRWAAKKFEAVVQISI